jgi:hypothetical protein
MLALPYLTEHYGFNGLILATEPTLQIGRLLIPSPGSNFRKAIDERVGSVHEAHFFSVSYRQRCTVLAIQSCSRVHFTIKKQPS